MSHRLSSISLFGHHLHRRLHVEALEDRRLLALVTVTTELDTFDPADGVTSIREAIFATNIVPGADDIVFDFGHDGPATILLEEGELEITEAVTITGDGPDLLTIDAQEQSRIFNITAETGDFTIVGMTLTGGRRTGNNFSGGAIRSRTTGNLTIQNSVLSGNSATGTSTNGGGVFAAGDVTIDASTVSGNSAEELGGGVYSEGNVAVTNSTISGNSAVLDAGVSAYKGNVVITSSTISDNLGGGVTGNNVTVISSMISGNSADGNGSGILAFGNVTVTDSTISGNSANRSGGGILAYDNVTVTSSTISGNSADGKYGGGGVFSHGDVTVTGSTISGNSSGFFAYGGGGIRGGIVTVTSSTISGNSANGSGGGILAFGNVTVTSSTISDNSAERSGGGIYGRDVTVTDSTISDNSADDYGGGGISGGAVTVTGSTISDNSAGVGGGIRGTNVTVTSSTISGNSAGSVGGGIWAHNDPVTIKNAIVAGNTDDGTAPDLRPGTATLSVEYSLVGDNTGTNLTEVPVGAPDANGNLIGGPTSGTIDPILGPLANNGGPTQTHALLPGSPAIDAGGIVVAGFDQRGSPFSRVYDGDGVGGARIDMGAFELQPQPGDLNGDLAINFADLTPFALALTDPAAYEAMYPDLDRDFLCDVSGDGLCNFGDLQPFADLLVGGEESGDAASVPWDPPALSESRQRPTYRPITPDTGVRDLALLAWVSSLGEHDDGGDESVSERSAANEVVGLPTGVMEPVLQGMHWWPALSMG